MYMEKMEEEATWNAILWMLPANCIVSLRCSSEIPLIYIFLLPLSSSFCDEQRKGSKEREHFCTRYWKQKDDLANTK